MNDLLNSSTGIVDNSPNASKVLDSLRYLDCLNNQLKTLPDLIKLFMIGQKKILPLIL